MDERLAQLCKHELELRHCTRCLRELPDRIAALERDLFEARQAALREGVRAGEIEKRISEHTLPAICQAMVDDYEDHDPPLIELDSNGKYQWTQEAVDIAAMFNDAYGSASRNAGNRNHDGGKTPEPSGQSRLGATVSEPSSIQSPQDGEG